MALVLGTAGMPHILMRFFTVPTAQEARKSVIWAMAIIGGFYVLTLFLGIGAAMNVGPATITAVDPGGNMAGPLLAQYLGGGPDSMLGNLFLAFVAAVAFATIVAVVAGLVLAAASAMAHDLYVGVITRRARDAAGAGHGGAHRDGDRRRDGDHDRHRCQGPERRAPGGARLRGGRVGELPVRAADAVLEALQHRRHRARHDRRHVDGDRAGAGLAEHDLSARDQGGAQKVVDGGDGAKLAKLERRPRGGDGRRRQGRRLKKAIATAREGQGRGEGQPRRSSRATTRSLVGLEKPLFELRNPGLISIPLGFLAVILGSLLYRDKRSEDMWDELYVRQNTGILAAKAAAH